MACINPNDPEFKKILKQVGGNPLIAAIEFNKLYPEEVITETKEVTSGVAEPFYDKNLIKNAGKDVSKIFENYLAQFGITVKDINEVKDKLNIDEAGYADILSKIAYVKNREELPEIAGEFIAYMMKYNQLVKDIILDFAKNDAKLKIKKNAIYYVASGLGKSVLVKNNPNKFADMDDLVFQAVKNITGKEMDTKDASMELNKNEDVGKELEKLISQVSDTKIILSPLSQSKIKNLGLSYKKYFVPKVSNVPQIVRGIAERSTNPYDISEDLYKELYIDKVAGNKNVFEIDGYIEDEFKTLSNESQNLEDFLQKNEYISSNNYSDLIKEQDYFKRIGILISNELKNRYDISNDKSLISKIKKIIAKFFSLFKKADVSKINRNIGTIVDNIIKQNRNFITSSLYKPGAEGKKTKQVSVESALDKDVFGKSIIYKLSEKGFILTGSTALAEQGTILRPDENPLHDIDWVSPFDREETSKRFMDVYPDAIYVREILDKEGEYVTDSYLIAPQGYKIVNYNANLYGEKTIIDSYDVANEKTGEIKGTYRREYDEDKGKIVEKETGIKGKVIDFFSYPDYKKLNKNVPFDFVTSDDVVIKLANWKDIFAAKLKFARYKDIWDYNRFVPYENVEDINEDVKSYIEDQILKTFGVNIPNKNNSTLISKADIDKFNDQVIAGNGVLPSEFYSGPADVHKWNLNEKGLYDLVDKITGEIYLRDVNLNKGVQEYVEPEETPIDEEERSKMIDSINDAVNEYRLDEILAEKGYDVQDFISNLEAATTQQQLNKIINKILNQIC